MSDFLAVIPARYASTRFPGKSLALIKGKPMIRWVYETAASLFDDLVVATDDLRIRDAVEKFGGQAVMTSAEHRSGTDRCAEAYGTYCRRRGKSFSHVVNIQGDEPLIKAEQLEDLTLCFELPGTEIATLVYPLGNTRSLEDPHLVKVVVDKDFRALYFSRAAIPYVRDKRVLLRDTGDHREAEGNSTDDSRGGKQKSGPQFYSHIGLYAFTADVLEKITRLSPTPLEIAESLEQLRWLENGYRIQTRVTNYPSSGVDTPEDLEKLRARF